MNLGVSAKSCVPLTADLDNQPLSKNDSAW